MFFLSKKRSKLSWCKWIYIWQLTWKIFSELSELKYKGMVIYSGYVEPLLHKRIYQNIAQARKFLPEAQIEIITNGDVLNKDRLRKLFEAGLSTLLISVYDGPDEEKGILQAM